MRMRRRDFLMASSAACLLSGEARADSTQGRTSSKAPRRFDAPGRQVSVSTTAEKDGLRLTPTDTLAFKRHGQPLETQVCVFVDPSKTYQTFLGIGGALTDASAETFARL